MTLKKIQLLQDEEKILHLRLTSVRDWLELLHEAEMVLENNLQSVSVKYIAPEQLLFQKQTFSSDIKSAVIILTLPTTLRPWRTTSPGLLSSIFHQPTTG